jgi:hypothetical protein
MIQCSYIRRDQERTPCDKDAEFDVRYFNPGDRGKPKRLHTCMRHLGKMVDIKMAGQTNTLAVYRHGGST